MLGEIEDIEQLEKLQYYYDNELLKTIQSIEKQLDEAQKSKQQQPTEDKEKVCNAAGNDKDKCKELKEKDCVFNKDGKDGEKCTLNEDAKKKVENEAENQAGKDGKT
ncbi:uncharacterized protein TEOVI_000496500 [Trypanosoma equiperdum]|uniref:Uncharacterized protein n=1 Tax=Trypanosoma equiperdum TaxID=5694 RepID=A0A1G4IKQ1_TRYEQ|nr:hypothetical protein TEOVI_000496500 [Trypanosoma equiperdum]